MGAPRDAAGISTTTASVWIGPGSLAAAVAHDAAPDTATVTWRLEDDASARALIEHLTKEFDVLFEM
jgi:hypothetical protein